MKSKLCFLLLLLMTGFLSPCLYASMEEIEGGRFLDASAAVAVLSLSHDRLAQKLPLSGREIPPVVESKEALVSDKILVPRVYELKQQESNSESFKKDILQYCLEEIIKYKAFEIDCIMDASQKVSENRDYIHNVNTAGHLTERLEQYMNIVKRMISCQQEIDLDHLLCLFLKDRLDFLMERSSELFKQEKSQGGSLSEDGGHEFYELEKIASYCREFETYEGWQLRTERDSKVQLADKDKAFVTFYQFFNQLIKDLYNLIPVPELSHKTCYFIRLSPTLWSLLEGRSTDLGHPDNAIYNPTTSPTMKNCDFDFFVLYYEKNTFVEIPIFGLGVPKGQTSVIVVSLVDSIQSANKKESITNPDSALAFTNQNRYRKKDFPDLPYPEFLREKLRNPVYKPVSPILPGIDSGIKAPEALESSFLPAVALEQMPSKQDQPLPKQEPSQHISQKPVLLSVAGPQGTKPRKRIKAPAKSPKVLEGKKKQEENPFQPHGKIFPPLPPRGMRIFHPYLLQENPKSVVRKNLAPNPRATLAAIFNHEQSTTVNYSNFSTLWKAINGKDSIKESSGSSHKALLDAEGNVVTGIFAHSQNTTYSKSTLPYLRTALTLVGYGS